MKNLPKIYVISFILALLSSGCGTIEEKSVDVLYEDMRQQIAAGFHDGRGSNARFLAPSDIAIDRQGSLYVTDSGSSTIRKISKAGDVSTLAGKVGVFGWKNGLGGDAEFSFPNGVAADSSGNVFVADQGSCTIRKILPEGRVLLYAGHPKKCGNKNGVKEDQLLFYPHSPVLGGDGLLYFINASSIARIEESFRVTNYAGDPDVSVLFSDSGYQDGPRLKARFNSPEGICFDPDGNLIVADTGNDVIRKVGSNGWVSTVAGSYRQPGFIDGVGSFARFNSPGDVACDTLGNVYVSDSSNSAIRKIDKSGVVSTLLDGKNNATRLFSPAGLAVDKQGALYIVDRFAKSVYRLHGATFAKLAGAGKE